MKKYSIDVFTLNSTGGNLAGIVLNCNLLSPQEMQEIASKLNFSETAFLSKINSNSFKIRYFTPKYEIDLCGHATIGAFSLMKKLNLISKDIYSLKTNVGFLNIFVEDEEVFMEQSLPEFFEELIPEEILSSLNISSEQLYPNIPIKIVSTGVRDIFIPIINRELLNSISPDFEKIKSISEKYNVIGYHLFTLEKNSNVNSYCRNFAPLYGIDEEAATGTSNCALACYLHELNLIKNTNFIRFIQGETLNNTSEIISKLHLKNNIIISCLVGGKTGNITLLE